MLKDMQRRRIALEERTFCALLNACARAGDLPAAERAFSMMTAAGVEPNVQTFTSLIDACTKDGADASLDRAFQVCGLSILATGLRHDPCCCGLTSTVACAGTMPCCACSGLHHMHCLNLHQQTLPSSAALA